MRTLTKEANPRKERVFSTPASSSAVLTPAPARREHPILHLQRTIGNQAVLRMLRARAAQAKAQSTATDEQEADHVAEQVTRMPEPDGPVGAASSSAVSGAHSGFSFAALQRAPSTLESSVSAPERQNLRVLASERTQVRTPGEIRNAMTDTGQKHIPADAVTFSPDIAGRIQQGLKNIAAEIYGEGQFPTNSVTNMRLDLTPYGGVNGVYRFTLAQRKTAPKVELVIEQVSNVPPADLDRIDISPEKARFESFGFVIGPGFSTDAKKHLYAALASVPEGILNRVKGLTFFYDPSAAGDANEPARYEPSTHAVYIYQGALREFANSIAASGADYFTGVLAHEIGHALDYETFTTARVKRDTLAKQLKEARIKSKQIKIDPNAPIGDDKPAADGDKKERDEIKRIEKDLDKAEADFAKATADLDLKKGGAHSQSKAFAKARGKAITSYGESGKNVEDFAELFSIFVLDSALLKSLRPDAFEYFSKTFP